MNNTIVCLENTSKNHDWYKSIYVKVDLSRWQKVKHSPRVPLHDPLQGLWKGGKSRY